MHTTHHYNKSIERSHSRNGLWLMAVLLCIGLAGAASAWGQSNNVIVMPRIGDTTITLANGVTYTVLDPGGTGLYPALAQSQVTLVSECGQPIFISGDFNCPNIYLFLLTDVGPPSEFYNIPTLIGDTGHLEYESIGSLNLKFFSTLDTGGWGFSFTVKTCCPSIYDVYASQWQGAGTLTLTWQDSSNATEWYVQTSYRSDTMTHTDTTHATHLTMTDLPGSTNLWYRIGNNSTACCTTPRYTLPTDYSLICLPTGMGKCIDISKRGACDANYYYGPYYNPHAIPQMVDYGSTDHDSRHTVHTDLYEYDSIAPLLKTVPEGYSASARLGGWTTGGWAEGVDYRVHVDTLFSNLMLLKYAAVMENPSHDYNEQPKFLFRILDGNRNPLSNECYNAQFVSNHNLGWDYTDNHHRYLWKDWTTVGFDLSEFHNQDIYISLQTYDCTQGGHTAWAYYMLECARKRLSSSQCGNTDSNTFTAPEGFEYRWYNEAAPNITLGTERSLSVGNSGVYHCQCSYSTSNNTDCHFTLTAIAGHRWPVAQGTWEIMEWQQCHVLTRLLDLSVVSTDEEHVNLTNYPCDAVMWRIDDTLETSDPNPILPLSVGTHTVTLFAYLGKGQCSDSTTFSFEILPPTHYDTVVICQGDSVEGHTESGNYGTHLLTDDGCDSLVLLTLVVNPTYDIQIHDTICSNQSIPWQNDSVSTGGTYFAEMLSSAQCDSNETLHLFVKPAYWNADIVRICNGRPYTWRDGVTYTESTNLPRIVYDANGCDSVIQLDLIISSNFHAAMNIRPQLVDYDNQEVSLRDISGGRTRQWHYMGLMDTSDVVFFNYPLEEDSVDVILIAVNYDDCTDTAYGLVRPDRAVLWAPNVFTPDESQNREFVIKSNELSTATVWVYDRGGNIMATFDALTGSWDGTCHGKPCKQAAYMWVMKYTTLTQPRQEKTAKGSVLLLR